MKPPSNDPENDILHRLLAEEPSAVKPSDALMQRLKAIPKQAPQQGIVVPFARGRVWALLAAAAALLLGVVTGRETSATETAQDANDMASLNVSDDASAFAQLDALGFSSELVTDLGQFEGEWE